MQMFGIGILELSVILILAVIVVGPDRLPQVAADLAKWIRQARAYATHLTRDFNEVVGELEKEVGASRDDWKEIASVVNRHTGDVLKEVQKASDQANATMAGTNGSYSNGANGNGLSISLPPPIETEAQATPLGDSALEPEADADAEPGVEKPWYEPERRTRRRSTD
jgi:sec-independent protein translocase protein TatB